MENLWQKINSDLKQAMRDKNEFSLSVLRLLMSAVSYKKIALNKGTDPEPLSDAEIIDVIAGEIKKRKDSIEAYTAGNRPELAEKETREIDVLQRYMPVQLGDDEIEKVVRETVAAIGEVTAKDFGRVMGQSMAKLKGKADGNKVGEIVKKVLEN